MTKTPSSTRTTNRTTKMRRLTKIKRANGTVDLVKSPDAINFLDIPGQAFPIVVLNTEEVIDAKILGVYGLLKTVVEILEFPVIA